MLTKAKLDVKPVLNTDPNVVDIKEQLRDLQFSNGRLVHVNDALTTIEEPFRVIQYRVKSSY